LINEGNINYLEKELISIRKDTRKAKEGTYINCGEVELIQLNTDLKDENDSSQIYFGKYKETTMLFTGDASIKSEEYILDNYEVDKTDILKVGHHGSKTSTSKKFIDTIRPKYSLISCGKDNKFNHPNSSVLKTLKTSKIYRTDQNGSVKFKLNKDNIKIEVYST
jgi:competence protein ComEC